MAPGQRSDEAHKFNEKIILWLHHETRCIQSNTWTTGATALAQRS
jgi:hypothetical protein